MSPNENTSENRVQLVIFDWAGTTVDFGCFAPVSAFIKAFGEYNVLASTEQARGPMGLHKRDHVRDMLRMPELSKKWLDAHGRDWTEDDVEKLYQTVTPLQAATALECDQLIPGVIECISELRSRNIKIGSTTGYPRVVAEPVIESAKKQGYSPDFNVCADDVPQGRPAPWMIYRNMEKLGIYPPSTVVKVGDTVPDIDEGLSAGCWSLGVTLTGSEVGWSVEDCERKSAEEQAEAVDKAKQKLDAAGAHSVMTTLADLPSLLDEINQRLAAGQGPSRIE